MATRSRLGYQLPDGSILSIYCHYDGYLEHNGVKLQEHFNTDEKVKELIDLGDISCLWTNAGWNNETLLKTGPLPYSSRGEQGVEPVLSDDLDYFLKLTNECGGEYAYVFANGQWKCYDTTTWNGTYGNELSIPVPTAA
jgi:hypothetical protein